MQIHASHINTWLDCRQRFYRSYILGEKIPPSIAIARGRSVHKAIEKNMASKFTTGELLPLEQVKDIARDSITEIFKEEEIRLDPKEVQMGEGAAKGKAVDTVIDLSALHHLKIAPAIEPTGIEKPWTLELDGYPYSLGGRIDLIDSGTILRDTKTKSMKPNQREVDAMIQLTVYSLAMKVNEGINPNIKVDYLIATKTPGHETLSTKRTDKNFDALFNLLDAFFQSLENEDFGPCNPTSWICSPVYCGYYNSCKYV